MQRSANQMTPQTTSLSAGAAHGRLERLSRGASLVPHNVATTSSGLHVRVRDFEDRLWMTKSCGVREKRMLG